MAGIKTTAIAVTFAYGIVVTSPASAQTQTSSNGGCKNTAVAAIVGGIFGALVGGKERAEAATIGAVVSAIACLALEASSTQTKTSDEVLQDYKAQHHGKMPDTITLLNYKGHSPTSVDRDTGQSVQLVSTGELIIPETQFQENQFFEELQLYVPGEKKPKIVKKQIAVTGSGGFQQSFSFVLDKNFPQGQYLYKTRILSSTNQVLGENSGKFQVI